MERIKLYSPNGKHGVNTLDCKARYDGAGNPVYPDGWQFLTDEQVKGLEDRTLAWENDKLVKYKETTAEKKERELEQKRLNAQAEITEILNWFNDVYDSQIKQAERCRRLGIEYDNKYGTVEELDKQAEIKAARIKELRAI